LRCFRPAGCRKQFELPPHTRHHMRSACKSCVCMALGCDGFLHLRTTPSYVYHIIGHRAEEKPVKRKQKRLHTVLGGAQHRAWLQAPFQKDHTCSNTEGALRTCHIRVKHCIAREARRAGVRHGRRGA
jgi:hypothetical protein